eukprot:755600-Hanusia_phi.AAC.3
MVDRRCAMTRVVRPTEACARASCTRRSLAVSSAEVASSSSMILGLRTSERAIAILCFCPPLNLEPPVPQGVLYPSGSMEIKSCAFAFLHAASHSSMVSSPPYFPYWMLWKMLQLKRTGSCETTPRRRRYQCRSRLRILLPSRSTDPLAGS